MTKPPAQADARRSPPGGRPLLLVLVLAGVLLLASPGVAQEVPWFIGLDSGVYRPVGDDWKRLGLGSGSSLAVHDGTSYIIGLDERVWTAQSPQGKWKPVSALVQGRRLAVDSQGTLYLVGTDGGIYRGSDGDWTRLGLASGQDVALGGGRIWIIGTDQKVWYRAVESEGWALLNPLALGRRIGVAPDGTVYIIGTDGGVYRVTNKHIERLGLAVGQDLSISPSGEPFVVGLDDAVWRYRESDWERYGGGPVREVAWPR